MVQKHTDQVGFVVLAGAGQGCESDQKVKTWNRGVLKECFYPLWRSGEDGRRAGERDMKNEGSLKTRIFYFGGTKRTRRSWAGSLTVQPENLGLWMSACKIILRK